MLKIFAAEKKIEAHQNPHGHWDTDGKQELRFYCQDGYIAVKEMQQEGKKRMRIDEFLRGWKA